MEIFKKREKINNTRVGGIVEAISLSNRGWSPCTSEQDVHSQLFHSNWREGRVYRHREVGRADGRSLLVSSILAVK